MPLPTERQRQAYDLRKSGKTLKEIAEELGVSAGRAEQLVDIYLKLQQFEAGTNQLLQSSPEEALDFEIIYLPIKNRSYHALHDAGIRTVRQLMQKTERELNDLKHFGYSSLLDVRQVLLRIGLKSPGQPVQPRQPKGKREVSCPNCGHQFEV
jgi:DNA-directed RNA polymerase alpha subunit